MTGSQFETFCITSRIAKQSSRNCLSLILFKKAVTLLFVGLVLFSAIAVILLRNLTIGDSKPARASAARSQNSSIVNIHFYSFCLIQQHPHNSRGSNERRVYPSCSTFWRALIRSDCPKGSLRKAARLGGGRIWPECSRKERQCCYKNYYCCNNKWNSTKVSSTHEYREYEG